MSIKTIVSTAEKKAIRSYNAAVKASQAKVKPIRKVQSALPSEAIATKALIEAPLQEDGIVTQPKTRKVTTGAKITAGLILLASLGPWIHFTSQHFKSKAEYRKQFNKLMTDKNLDKKVLKNTVEQLTNDRIDWEQACEIVQKNIASATKDTIKVIR